MPTQAVALVVQTVDVCPVCARAGYVYSLTVAVNGLDDKRRKTAVGCLFCLFLMRGNTSVGHPHVELRTDIRIRDVIDVEPSSAGRRKVRVSQQRERTAAEQICGKRTPGSGSGTEKGDARDEHWMVEDKGSTGKEYKLSRATVGKAVGQAAQTGRKAVIKVGLSDGTELAVMLWSDFIEGVHEKNQATNSG